MIDLEHRLAYIDDCSTSRSAGASAHVLKAKPAAALSASGSATSSMARPSGEGDRRDRDLRSFLENAYA